MHNDLNIVTLTEIYRIVLQQENAETNICCLNLSDAYKEKIGLI